MAKKKVAYNTQAGNANVSVSPRYTGLDDSGNPSGGAQIGVSQGIGNNTTVGVQGGANTQGSGNVGAGVSHQVNDQVSVNAGVGVQGDNVGANVGASYRPNDELSVGVGYGTNGLGATVQTGDSDAARVGGAVGGIAGGVVGGYFGGPVGAAAGSAVGSAAGSAEGQGLNDIYNGKGSGYGTAVAILNPTAAATAYAAGKLFGKSQVAKERDNRDRLRSAYQRAGIFDANNSFTLPDGTVANFDMENEIGAHDWYDASRRNDKSGDRNLFAFETDYTNDTDYLSGMLGMNLSRMLSGGSNKQTDQLGQAIGNQMLGKVGYGAALTEDNFNAMITNHKAMYAKAGIDNKEEYIGLANKMYADHRINESEYTGMLQGADILFDGDYNKATSLMAGRWKGIETANATPEQTTHKENMANTTNGGSYVRNTVVTPEDAMNSVQPFFDAYTQRYGAYLGKGGSGNNSTLNGLISGLVGAAGINKATGGAVSGGIKDLYQIIKDQIAGNSKPATGGSSSSSSSSSSSVPDAESDVGNIDINNLNLNDQIDWGATDYNSIPQDSYSSPEDTNYQLDDSAFSDTYSSNEDTGFSLF